MIFRKVLFICLLFAFMPGMVVAEIGDATLVKKLQQGGYVILVRHAIASNSQRDTDFENLSNCETQRNLTQAGRQQAGAIGNAFKALQIPSGKIYSSLFCRCIDTAELAFGKPEPLLDLSSFVRESGEEKNRRVNVIKHMLGTPPADNTNTILVTHSYMLTQASNVRLMEGHAAVFLPQGNNQFQLVAQIPDNRWQQMWEAVSSDEGDEL